MSFNFKSFADTGHHIHGHNEMDPDGNPTGGWAVDSHLARQGIAHPHEFSKPYATIQNPRFIIRWQDGPLDREAGAQPNGAFVEDVLEVCRVRLRFYQQSKFACEANAKAIDKIQEAIDELMARREDRKDRGVLGKNLT